jgi:hypothetical protein
MRASTPILSTILLVLLARALAAQSPAWELTPYRIELCVIVEPSTRLASSFESDLTTQLTSRAQAAHAGLWQVTANPQQAAARTRLLRELPLADPLLPVKADKEVDKVFFVAVRQQASQFLITAREWDVLTQLWNIPVQRQTPQAGQIASEALAAVQEAFGPIARVDESNQGRVTLRLRGGALPRRDGTYLTPDRRTVYRPVLVQLNKDGMPVGDSPVVLPWSYFVPQSSPGTTAARSLIRCDFVSSLDKAAIPDYHPLQLRLAVGLARSTESIRLQVIDEESPHLPLEGLTVSLRDLFAPPGDSFTSPGVTARDGRFTIAATGPVWVRILSGDEPLVARPIVPGLQLEWQLPVRNDRRRLQLAAALDQLHDDLLDLQIRLGLLGKGLQQSVQDRDLVKAARSLQEIRTLADDSRYSARLADLEKQLAAAGEATRARLQPSLAKAQTCLTQVKAVVEKIDQLPAALPMPEEPTTPPDSNDE